VDANGRFEFERRLGGAVWLVTVHGEHGSGVEPGFDQAMAVVAGAAAVVVDVSLSRLDSSELATLLRHARPVRGRADRLVVVGQPGSAGRRLLDLCGAERFVRVFDTAEEAVSELATGNSERRQAGRGTTENLAKTRSALRPKPSRRSSIVRPSSAN
jgi:anti-anti-sigma regulatory factor